MRQFSLPSASIFKFIMFVLVAGIIGLFIKQNLPTFKSPQPFSLDLYVAEKVVWSLSLYVLLLLTAGLGFVIGTGLLLRPLFQTRRLLAAERAASAQKEAQYQTAGTAAMSTVEVAEKSENEAAKAPENS